MSLVKSTYCNVCKCDIDGNVMLEYDVKGSHTCFTYLCQPPNIYIITYSIEKPSIYQPNSNDVVITIPNALYR